jgi:endonuclease YncB( thermonuclease family)
MKQLLLLLLIMPALVMAQGKMPKNSATYDAQIIRVSDGDTIVIAAPFLPAPLKPELAVRIYGVDTPEKGHRAQCPQEDQRAQLASKFTTQPYNPQTSTRLLFMDGISLVVVYWETSW